MNWQIREEIKERNSNVDPLISPSINITFNIPHAIIDILRDINNFRKWTCSLINYINWLIGLLINDMTVGDVSVCFKGNKIDDKYVTCLN